MGYYQNGITIPILILILTLFTIIVYSSLYRYKNNNKINNNINIDNNTFMGDSGKKLAFGFLAYGVPKQNGIWREFFGEDRKDYYNIYIHAKNLEEVKADKYWGQYLIKDHIQTAWGTLSLVKATMLLMLEMLKDPTNYKFILVCDQSIPIKSFEYIYNVLTEDNKSIFSYYLPKRVGLETKHYDRYQKHGEKDRFELAGRFLHQEQWMVLNREHVTTILSRFKQLNNYRTMFAPDECFFINELILSKIDDQNSQWHQTFKELEGSLKYPMCKTYDEFKQHDRLMWANWGGKNDRRWHPIRYGEITPELMKKLRQSKCLFARKFGKEILGNGH